MQHLPLEEKVALINAGRYNNSSSNTAPSPAAVESTSDTSAAVLSPVGVTNVKVGNKKLTVRAGNSSSGGAAARTAGMGGSDPPPPAYDDLPPPPAYEDKTAAPAPAPIPAAAPAPAPAAPVMTARPVPTPPLPRTVPVAPFAAAPAAQVAPKRPAVPQLPGSISSSAGSLKEYSALTPVPEEVPSQSVSPAAVPMPPLPAAEEPHNRGDSPPEFEASDIDEREDDDEETKRRKFNRRSYIKKDNLPEAFKNLEPIDPLVLHELILREQEEKAVAAALQAQKLAASTTSSVPASGAAGSQPAARSVQQSSSSSSSSMAGATEVTSAVTTSSAGRQESAHPATANSTKEGTDLVEELMAQGYSRENAVTLAKEIEMDRRAERFRNSGAGGSGGSGGSGGGFNGAGPSSFPDSYSNSRAGPPRSGSSVVSHNSSSYNYGGATAYGRERASFDRSFNNEDDVGSVVSNISAFSRQSSVCENDKLLMNLLLSQQKGKFGVNMYESLTNSDEPAIERYVARGLTLDQAVLKVFENKYGAVDNQSMVSLVYFIAIPFCGSEVIIFCIINFFL